MSDPPDPFTEHFNEEVAESLHRVFRIASQYGEGDALAGMKLDSLDEETYQNIEDRFEEAGFDVSLGRTRMGLVGFVSSPELDDERLNEAIRNL